MTTEGGEWTYPVLPGTVGADVVDIRKLYGAAGLFTYDPGFTSTASCRARSPISTASRASCSTAAIRSTSWPSIRASWRCLPAALRRASEQARARQFTYTISRHTMLHEQLSTFYRGFRAMRTRWRSCAAWSARFALLPRQHRHHRSQQRMIASHRLIAKMPTIAAMAYKYSVGQPFMYPTTPQLHRQLPAHDLRRPGRAL
jgi:citrate synthase